MPTKPLGPCTIPGCAGRATHSGKCKQHDLQRRRQYDQVRPSAAERGYDSEWQRVRTTYLKAHPQCYVCDLPATQVDPITPRREGGSKTDWTNLRPYCHRHHSMKTGRQDNSQAWGRQAG